MDLINLINGGLPSHSGLHVNYRSALPNYPFGFSEEGPPAEGGHAELQEAFTWQGFKSLLPC